MEPRDGETRGEEWGAGRREHSSELILEVSLLAPPPLQTCSDSLWKSDHITLCKTHLALSPTPKMLLQAPHTLTSS